MLDTFDGKMPPPCRRHLSSARGIAPTVAHHRVLSKLVFNRESQSTLPSLALVFILGILAAIKALPAYDLRLLWAMFSSLALVVGAAAIKFRSKRPNFAELVEWAWDSVSSSVSSSPVITPSGSSAMPHFGHVPGPTCSISGCMGQV